MQNNRVNSSPFIPSIPELTPRALCEIETTVADPGGLGAQPPLAPKVFSRALLLARSDSTCHFVMSSVWLSQAILGNFHFWIFFSKLFFHPIFFSPPKFFFSFSFFCASLGVSCYPECSNSVGEARRDTMLPSISSFFQIMQVILREKNPYCEKILDSEPPLGSKLHWPPDQNPRSTHGPEHRGISVRMEQTELSILRE